MLRPLTAFYRHPRRGLLAGLLLASAGARAQTGRPPYDWHVAAQAIVYVDGQRSTVAALQHVDPEAVSSADGLSGQPGVRRLVGDTVATELLVITTKANASSPAVLALADKFNLRSAYTEKPATLLDVAPKALAYITRCYPDAWLLGGVTERTRKSTGAITYRVQLGDKWGMPQAEFTPQGDFVGK